MSKTHEKKQYALKVNVGENSKIDSGAKNKSDVKIIIPIKLQMVVKNVYKLLNTRIYNIQFDVSFKALVISICLISIGISLYMLSHDIEQHFCNTLISSLARITKVELPA